MQRDEIRAMNGGAGAAYLKPQLDRVQQPDVVPGLMSPLLGVPQHSAAESKA
jgi:hypothetical protein